MFKKNRTFSKSPDFPNRRRLYLVSILFLGLSFWGCRGAGQTQTVPQAPHEVEFEALIDALIPVWEAVSNREELALFGYTGHPNPVVRETAWRGLANFEVPSTPYLLERVLESDGFLPWFALSTQTLNASQLRTIEAKLEGSALSEATRMGIFLVLGERGDAVSQQTLMGYPVASLRPEETYHLGLAVSRLLLRFPVAPEVHLSILDRAKATSDEKTKMAWLYAYYRAPSLNVPGDFTMDFEDWVAADWDSGSMLFRQYALNILSKLNSGLIWHLAFDEFMTSSHALEGVEAARGLFRYPVSEKRDHFLSYLLMHPSEYVRLEVLQGINQAGASPEILTKSLENRLEQAVPMSTLEWMWHIRALAKWEKDTARRLLAEAPREWTENPHFVNDYIEMLKAVYIVDDVLDQLMSLAHSSNDAILVTVIQQASQLAMAEPANNEKRALVAQILLQVAASDEIRVSRALALSNQALSWEADQSDPRLLAHIEAGKELINRKPDGLLRPDADLIKKLGPHPVWVIESELGSFSMKLNSLQSPSTVTAFATISANGWYTGTPFHRVVNNFVIQGGSLWTGPEPFDPPFTVPTEATENDFSRGAVGVASSGRDTEGSQFFMMHMWHPHLNGRYSNIGKVFEGMEVVDAITQGTLVLKSEIRKGY